MINVRAFQTVAKQIEEYISDASISPGSKIPAERNLALMYSVSRTTVRQAISYLVEQGVLVSRQGDGTYVSASYVPQKTGQYPKPIENEEYYSSAAEIIEARTLLECEMARLCAIRAGEATCRRLAGFIEQYENMEDQEYDHINADFHMTLAEGTCNRVYVSLLGSLMNFMKNPVWMSMNHQRRHGEKYSFRHNVNQHIAIAKAVIAHDPVEAERLMKEHISGIKESTWMIFGNNES